jgi:hypothetical protein
MDVFIFLLQNKNEGLVMDDETERNGFIRMGDVGIIFIIIEYWGNMVSLRKKKNYHAKFNNVFFWVWVGCYACALCFFRHWFLVVFARQSGK